MRRTAALTTVAGTLAVGAAPALADGPSTGAYRGSTAMGSLTVTVTGAAGGKRYARVVADLAYRCPSGGTQRETRALHPGKLVISRRGTFGYQTPGRTLRGRFADGRATGTIAFQKPFPAPSGGQLEVCDTGRVTFRARR